MNDSRTRLTTHPGTPLFHSICLLILLLQGAVGQTINNPSFEADVVPPFPGYGTITGWTSSRPDGFGINDSSGPFADNGVIPDGSKVAFLQQTMTLSQTVSGFTPGSEYRLLYYENARNCCGGTASLALHVGDQTVVAAHAVNPGGYRAILSDPFVASAATLEIRFEKTGEGDATPLIDHVQIVPPNTPPEIVQQPATQLQLVGGTATFTVAVSGSGPLEFQWRFNGNDLEEGTNATLILSDLAPDQQGRYMVVVSNPFGETISSNATLTLREPIAGLFNTGVDDNRVVLADGAIDPHWLLVTNADSASLDAIVEDSTSFPIVAGPWLANNTSSKWIGPRLNTAGAAGLATGNGIYVYRTHFDLSGKDLPSVVITGGWAIDNEGLAIRVNGIDTGLNNFNGFGGLTEFTINSANATFIDGSNTLEFVVRNVDEVAGYTGLRVANLVGSAALPGTPPEITAQPESQIVQIGETANFAVVATGSAPLEYQWLSNGVAIAGATARTFELTNASIDFQAAYAVVVNNLTGSVTSRVAQLFVFERVPGIYNTGVDDSGVPLADNSVDPHYRLITNAQDSAVSEPLVQDSTVFPIVAGPWLPNTASSKWIGPQFNTSQAAVGTYIYRTILDLSDRDPQTAVVVGRWSVDNTGVDIRVNGVSTGNPQSPGFTTYTPFALASSNAVFYAGVNTIDFVVENVQAAGYTGLRVDNLKTDARVIAPGTAPTIRVQPQAQAVRQSQDVTLSVVAVGSAPLQYQWYFGDFELLDETNATLVLTGVLADQAGQYRVRVFNNIGEQESATASITVGPALELGIALVNQLTLTGEVGRVFRVEFAEDPGNPVYNTLTNIVLPQDPFVFVDPTPNPGRRIYRVTLEP